jgi:6-phosphofructokinase 1
VLAAHQRGWRTYGIQRGFEGLLSFDGVVLLGPEQVRGITHLGGTILGTTNRGNPFRYVRRDEAGVEYECDRSDDLCAAFQASGFDALVSIGGDGSLQIAHELSRKGLPVVCVPKTIDNDVAGTQRTFGFDTAVSTATEAIDRLHSTAESHDRVIVVELMGRHAGWIALNSGLSGSADVILIPEIPFDITKVCHKIRERELSGRHFSIVVVAEGAAPRDGTVALVERRGVGTVDRLGGWRARWHARSQTGRARRSARWCWATSSAADRRRRTTGCSRSASGPRRCGRSPTARSAAWSGSTAPRSPAFPSRTSSAAPRTCRSTPTPS